MYMIYVGNIIYAILHIWRYRQGGGNCVFEQSGQIWSNFIYIYNFFLCIHLKLTLYDVNYIYL
jgi:hypothetical protein